MQYALMIHVAPAEYEGLNQEERQGVSAEYYALREDSRVVGGAALHPAHSATTVRGREGETVITDGPFADTKEVFGGWYLVEAADLDSALEVAGRIPALRFGGSVEIRPVVEEPH
ncbi:MAG TPA: YciI family protein [Solirubrobacteraceae bacterium]|jgi:hypothetical protein